MLRHALAHLLHAVADRLETERPEPEIQYVYIYSSPPATTAQPWQVQPWQSPITYTSSNTSTSRVCPPEVLADSIANIPEHPPRNLTPGSGTLCRH